MHSTYKESKRIAYVLREDNFDIDRIIGVQNIRIQDPEKLALFAQENLGSEFQKYMEPGAILIGGRNFGFGHPHIQALIGIRSLGVSAILADSFTPALWRGALSNGFPLIKCPGISSIAQTGDDIELNHRKHTVYHKNSKKVLNYTPYTKFEKQMLQSGGIVSLLVEQGKGF